MELISAEEREKMIAEIKENMTVEVALEVLKNANLEKLKNRNEIIKELDTYNNVDIKIEELDLSIRSYNCLMRYGFKTVKDIANTTKEDMMKVRNLGKKSLREIEKKLAEYGLTFKDEKPITEYNHTDYNEFENEFEEDYFE